MNEYHKILIDEYDMYLKRIDDHYNNSKWVGLPTDSFYFKLTTGKISVKKENIEWLEYAVEKLQNVLGKIEQHIERENFKKLKGLDLLNRLKKL